MTCMSVHSRPDASLRIGDMAVQANLPGNSCSYSAFSPTMALGHRSGILASPTSLTTQTYLHYFVSVKYYVCAILALSAVAPVRLRRIGVTSWFKSDRQGMYGTDSK
jgi:hypothetical protein